MAEFINTVDVIGDNALTDSLIDRSITEFKDDAILTVGQSAFYGCTALTSVDFPAVTSIGHSAFRYCNKLTSVRFPAATSTDQNAFYGCTALTSVDFPAITKTGSNMFADCSTLTSVDFPAVTSIGGGTFYFCKALTALILRKTDTVCTLSETNAFSGTPIASGTGYIYVPKTMADGSDGVATYQASTNWSNFSSQIKAIEDYPDITGG